jgi:hypothetical protein
MPRATFRFRSWGHDELLRKFLRSCQLLLFEPTPLSFVWKATKGISRLGWITYCCVSSQTKVDSQFNSRTHAGLGGGLGGNGLGDGGS